MNRYTSIVCSVIFFVMVSLPSQVSAASITEGKAAIGMGCVAGDNSTAMGLNTTASGWASTTMGVHTLAAGDYSFAGGRYMQLNYVADNTFVWGHSDTQQSATISTRDAFLIFPVGTPGRVGIGTPAPQHTLEIQGAPGTVVLSTLNQVGAIAWSGRRFDRDSSEKWFIGMSNADDKLLFRRTASSNDMVIDEAGLVGIGTDNPGYKLEVNGDAAKTSGGTVWINSSDERLKDITGEYQRGLDAITSLRPVTFFYKHGNPRGLPTHEENIGFIAQQVEEVFPEAVSEGKDGYLDFNMHPVNVAVVNAIKELKAENNALKAENMELREDIAQIKAALGM